MLLSTYWGKYSALSIAKRLKAKKKTITLMGRTTKMSLHVVDCPNAPSERKLNRPIN
jgi:hypothetical protein